MSDKQTTALLLAAFTLLLGITLSFGCEDLDEQLCKQIEDKYLGLCNDTCLSQMCQRRCGMCPVKCYQCHEIDNPKNCSTSVECPTKDHYCYTTQSFTDDFIEIYKLGCATKSVCKGYFGDRVGRGLRIEATCCENDNCNNMTPEEIANEQYINSLIHKHDKHPVNITAPNLMQDCRNIDEQICTRLGILDPDFCINNTCAATKLCPRMCRKCFNCYTCDDVDKIGDCNVTSTCSDGKSCFSLDFRPVYRLGCMDTNLCHRFQTSSVGFGKRQDIQLKGGCCTTDVCNGKMSLTTTAATTTTYVQGCHQQTATSCPSGVLRYNNYCYYLGSRTMTWSQAKAYCQTKCAHLADFTSENELITLYSKLHLHHLVHGRPSGPAVWTDAVRTGHKWVWSTTGSSIDLKLTQHLKAIEYCAVIHDGNRAALLAQPCSSKVKPLCKSF